MLVVGLDGYSVRPSNHRALRSCARERLRLGLSLGLGLLHVVLTVRREDGLAAVTSKTLKPSVRYRTLVVDPPWPYPEGFAEPTGRPHKQDRERGVSVAVPVISRPLPYPSMTLDAIRNLPIGSLASTDARLFLWATNRYLPDAFELLDGWGFKYRQLLVWDKTPNLPPFGGSVAPNAGEFLVVSARGAPGRIGRWDTSIVRARKGRTTHSRKPDVFLDLVETVSPGPYLEMFARRQRLGWDTWGNEALEHVELSA